MNLLYKKAIIRQSRIWGNGKDLVFGLSVLKTEYIIIIIMRNK
ncbi:hypothetical protein NEICINOT_03993 [Neisseria cinerea ATCC 14685]|uniref:Uncharacterized protein n=1 Tax=Neisseria cinerea ATCC 14685 TaxID=546262 RepID=D0W2V8_NEICI|nr:hypothetical protein NEICINOT_03993 [Neisseria cinerea ATCC 14685]